MRRPLKVAKLWAIVLSVSGDSINNKLQRLRDLQFFGEEGGVVPVIDVASTSTFMNPEDMPRAFKGEMQGCYLYSRHSNPTVQMFSKKIASMEGSEAALGVASGMAAISASIEAIAQMGDHVVAHSVIYGGSYALFKNILPKRGIEVSFGSFDTLADIEKLLKANTKILYLETLSNPMLNISNFETLRAFKTKYPNIKIIVDNTFAPLMASPLKWGADVVVHSCTKFISGSSDLIAGAICGSKEFIDSLIDINSGPIMLGGAVMDPRVAHELYMRLDHLHLRMKGHSERAMQVAELAEKLEIPVAYPGLSSHPHHERANKYFDTSLGYGGMLTLDLGTPERAFKIASQLQKDNFALYAVSLGFSRTLITCPALSTSSEIPEEEQKAMSLSPGLLRLSMGFTGDATVMLKRFESAISAARL